jgi:hypothetical protein
MRTGKGRWEKENRRRETREGRRGTGGGRLEKEEGEQEEVDGRRGT